MDQTATPSPALSLADIRAGQNFPLAIAAGVASAIIGAGLWAAATVITHMQLGIVSVGVGLLIGYAIRKAGNGIDDKFRYLGAACAILGCLIGAIFTDIALLAEARHISIIDTLGHIKPEALPTLLEISFQPMDLLFYAIAIYEAFKVSRRWKVTAPAKAPAA